DKDTGFPTLISLDAGENSQQQTDASFWLYYSSLQTGAKTYHGHRVLFTIANTTPPVTTAIPVGPPGLNGWYTGPTTVVFTVVDDLYVVKTEYSLGATWKTGSSVSLKVSGVYDIQYRSTDVAGNAEPAHSTTVMLDVEAPLITESASPSAILDNVRV